MSSFAHVKGKSSGTGNLLSQPQVTGLMLGVSSAGVMSLVMLSWQ